MTSDGAAPFVPDDFVVPLSLVTEAFRLEPLGPEHNEADYAAWHSSIDHIRSTPGMQGRSWPRPEMTLDDNLKDLRGHARDFANRTGFTYTVRDPDSGEIIGCVYIYPWKNEPGVRVLSWVRASRASLDKPVYEAVSEWVRTAWPFTSFAYAPR
jgi:RimJ/RimL family protein N-acetyltransferase